MKTYTIFILLVFTSLFSYCQGSNGLVAHWNFNGNANDVSGHNLNGIVSGATLSAGYNGIANTAYKFNGINNFIDVPSNSLLNLDTFSICALVKPAGYYSGACHANSIMIMGSDQDTALSTYALYFSNAAYYGGCVSSALDHETFYGLAHHVQGSSATIAYASSDTIKLNTWYCVTVTYSKDTVRTYVDGILQNKQSMLNTFLPIFDTLGIGYYRRGVVQYPYWFNGIMDDIRLYNRPLSAAEVGLYCDTAKMLPLDVNQQTYLPEEMLISPNPARNFISIQFPAYTGICNVKLLNTLGQVIAEINSDAIALKLDMSNLPAGIYIVRVLYNGHTAFRKILKE